MLLNALSNYLSNQPLANAESSAPAAAAAAPGKEADKELAADLKDLYHVSDRAVLISAVASEFDVTSLSQEDIGRMQTRLQEYGLLSGRELNGMQYLFQAGAAQAGAAQTVAAEAGASTEEATPQSANKERVNAVAVLDNLRNSIAEHGCSFSVRQQVGHFHTLISNLASARPF